MAQDHLRPQSPQMHGPDDWDSVESVQLWHASWTSWQENANWTPDVRFLAPSGMQVCFKYEEAPRG